MAKRSDFAQKLLDDLKLRKEKLGFASSSQRSTPATSGGARVNSQRSFQGPVEATTNKFRGKNMVDTEVTKLWIGTRHHNTTAQEGASRAIVPVGRATNTERTVDVSMALALALSKTGKLQNIELFTNAMVGNERILHRGSISFRENNGRYMSDRRNSTDHHPFLSHQQISEISKGVQKLNKILEICSNGPKFKRDSIDLGRELLRGAMDLEESLRMLVTLQEASDYMVGSQGKQVRLLKDKDEDESSSNTTSRKKSTNRTKFSSDGFQEQNILALSYPRKSKTPTNSNKSLPDPSMQFISHRRSLSCGPGFGPDAQFSGIASSIREEPRSISSGKNSSTPENIKQLGSKGIPACDKVRIPNVVAKLMGLEELPVPPPKADGKNGEAHKVPKLKKETEMGKTLIADTGVSKKEVDIMTSLQKNIFRTGGQNNVPQEKGIREAKVAHSRGKTNLKSLTDIENTSPASNYLPGSSLKISKQMDIANMAHSKKDRVTQKEVKESRENVFIKEQRSKVKVEQTIHDVKKPILVNQDDAARKKDSLKKYEINFQDGFSVQNNSSISTNDAVSKHISTAHGAKSKYSVHDSAMETGHDAEHKPETKIILKGDPKLKKAEKPINEMSRQKVFSGSTVITASQRSSSKSGQTEKSKDDPKRSHQEKPKLWNRRSTYHEADRKAAKGNLGNKKTTMTDLRIDKEKAMPPSLVTATKKPVHIPTIQKVDTADTTVHRGDSNRIYEDRSENIGNPNAEGEHLKEQTSFPDELEHGWKERTNKADRAKVSIHAMNSDKHLQQQLESTTISNSKHIDDSRHTTKTPEMQSAAETNSYSIINLATDTQRTPQLSPSNDPEIQPFKSNGKESEGPIDLREISSNPNLLEWQTRAVSEADGQGSLTKNQCLIQVLVNNQRFLNTAQALFKLKIPIGFLKANENSCPVKDNKLLLDCGYELIRRKGKREEVTYAMSMSYAPVKVRCLDTLITELNDDLESLKFLSNIEDNNYDTAEFLHKMLEKDIQNMNPDVNCMWDLGWNVMVLAPVEKDEVIRDVEKHVLNALINELARDLIEVSLFHRKATT
ncbi:uncharacterized protein [Elaeis guineensis]|uniref:Uncharacterized protein LOC105060738 n=1 Tax=Elaeis guineensis var. tenera TaxID=51953 RepID=A0A6I9SNJ4_ELAGV|nr:uncharacterized protein LOC105060738 [Elaeis guineensis]